MEDINVSKIFQMNDVFDPFNLQEHENIPVTTYKLVATIRNKVFNYKQTVETIELEERQSLNDDIYPCNCENSEFGDADHVLIMTRDLHLTKNQKIRKLFTKGRSFREPQSLNDFRCKKEIELLRNLLEALN